MNKIKIPILFSRISKLQKKYFNDNLKNFNLESSQGIILLKIKELKKITPTQLIDLGIIEKPAISKTLKKLEGLGYIIKSQSNKDARSFSVSLTKDGNKIASYIEEILDEMDTKFQAILNDNSIKEIGDILDYLEKEETKKSWTKFSFFNYFVPNILSPQSPKPV